MSTLASAIQRGTRASQPAATAVSIGCLYCVTDESNLVERSNGTTWDSYSASGAGSGTVTHTAGNLTASAVMVGNGSADSKVLASLGTTTTLLHGNAAGLPTFAAVSLTADVTGVLPSANGGTKFVQVVNTQTGAVATGTTVIPVDNTIPQNTEGDEYMTLAITPTSATNKLRIDVVLHASSVNATNWMTAALFQDATAGALACSTTFMTTATSLNVLAFTHYMTSGTTSSTTFKVRAGANSAGTTTFNGQSSARLFGGVFASSITISELVP